MAKLPLNTRDLEELNKQCKHLNIHPIYLANYYYEDKKNPVTKLLSKLVLECIESLSMMNEDEIKSIISSIPPELSIFVEDGEFMDFFNETYLERLSLYYLAGKISNIYLNFNEIVNFTPQNSVVFAQYPELKDKIDKNGLLIIDNSFELYDGGIVYKDHVLHYHQFLRRGFTGNPNFVFLSKFISYYFKSKKTNQFRIAIDPVRLMPKEYFQHIAERDTWFGANFSKDKLDDIYSIGLSVKKRIKPSPFDSTNKLDRTEFFWSYRDNIKTLEIEEISDIDHKYDEFNINRYIHSERNVNQKIIQHFDGAVKIYQHNYNDRYSTQLPNEIRSTKYIKLFRIDGIIDIDLWIELIAYFFKGNEMLLEYFDPDKFESKFKEKIKQYQCRHNN